MSTRLSVVDCDVHHDVRSQQELYGYLDPGWREFVTGPAPDEPLSLSTEFPHVNPHGFFREDAFPADGGPPGSSLDLMREQLLDPLGVERAILTGGQGLYVAAVANPYLAAAAATAYNRHTIEHWVEQDERLRGSIVVPNQIPELGGEEIRRWADHPGMVQAVLCTNAVGHPFGHPIFDPIHRACAETGLPLAIHSLGEGAAWTTASHLAGGKSSFYLEYHCGGVQGVMTHLMSFVFHGVFEKYPELQLVLVESGVLWVPGFVRRMDVNFRGLRREVPWCRKLPSEYVREHVLFTTQPLDLSGGEAGFWASLDEDGIADRLLFASDYPHWDADDPLAIWRRLPAERRDATLRGRACELYGFELTPA
jgi:predicted TIM-barrel fold metal-dependent hydrolase